MDAWLREAEEASRWVEDLENRISHKNFNFSVTNSARSKLLDLGVKLDRLESLLRNPPTKPILSNEDLDFRWKLFSDIQLRTRTLARSLYALPCPTRPRNVSDAGSIEYNVSNDYNDDQDLLKRMYSQGQSELAKQPLLQSDDENRTQIQPYSFMSGISLWKACTFLFFLGLVALLVILLLAAIQWH